MAKTFNALKAELLQIKEEFEMKDIIQNLDARKAAIKIKQKEEMKLHKKLTASVKKAGKQMPGSLDFNSPDNMYYSEKSTERFLENHSIMDAYNASKLDQEWN
jgi:CRISPR/Cas system-associated protein Cas5 (RAMP superfamily)